MGLGQIGMGLGSIGISNRDAPGIDWDQVGMNWDEWGRGQRDARIAGYLVIGKGEGNLPQSSMRLHPTQRMKSGCDLGSREAAAEPISHHFHPSNPKPGLPGGPGLPVTSLRSFRLGIRDGAF